MKVLLLFLLVVVSVTKGEDCRAPGPCELEVSPCVFEPLKCVSHDPCVRALGCSMQTGYCEFQPVSCNDGDPCTADTCDAGRCVYTQVEDCVRPVELRVRPSLQISKDHTFCHYGDPSTEAHLGFSEYVAGEPGTCDMDSPQSNGWYVQEEGVYCHKFSLDDLLRCRNHTDRYGRLFSGVGPYKGHFHYTAIKDKWVVDSTLYNVTLYLDRPAEVESNIDLRFLEHGWDPLLRIHLEGRGLCDPETDGPFEFLDATTLRALVSGDIVGEYTLTWRRCYSRSRVIATMKVNAVQPPSALRKGPGAVPLLYLDENFSTPYRGEELLPRTKLYGEVRSSEGKVVCKSVSLCFGETLESYDAARESETGCNSPGTSKVVLWSESDGIAKDDFRFHETDAPSVVHFSFTSKQYSEHPQIMQLTFDVYGEDGGAIEFFEDDEDDGHQDHLFLHTHCPSGYRWSGYYCYSPDDWDGWHVAAVVVIVVIFVVALSVCVCHEPTRRWWLRSTQDVQPSPHIIYGVDRKHFHHLRGKSSKSTKREKKHRQDRDD